MTAKRRPPEIDYASVLEYWQLVRAELVRLGLAKTRAARVAAAYRRYVKPAGWTVYNRDPEDSARLAVKLEAWQKKGGPKT